MDRKKEKMEITDGRKWTKWKIWTVFLLERVYFVGEAAIQNRFFGYADDPAILFRDQNPVIDPKIDC